MTDIVDRLLDATDRDAVSDAVEEINALRDDNAKLRAALRFAAGYISTFEPHKNAHPEDVLKWVEDSARAALDGESRSDLEGK